MRFATLTGFAKVLTLVVAATLLAASISVSAKTGDMSLDEAKEVITEMVSDGVHEVQQVQEPERRAHKPRIGTMGVRQMWNECVGMDASEAIDLIRTARPDLKRVIKVPEGSMVTMDMRMDRVRVFCDADNVVTRPPRVG